MSRRPCQRPGGRSVHVYDNRTKEAETDREHGSHRVEINVVHVLDLLVPCIAVRGNRAVQRKCQCSVSEDQQEQKQLVANGASDVSEQCQDNESKNQLRYLTFVSRTFLALKKT